MLRMLRVYTCWFLVGSRLLGYAVTDRSSGCGGSIRFTLLNMKSWMKDLVEVPRLPGCYTSFPCLFFVIKSLW
ncbi:hypothetical protein BDQ17DRAFT_576369 [Cyathus striatus]|nr:hypothetical protein BDQ17DRAFT_576369 [Cyathus striatus]